MTETKYLSKSALGRRGCHPHGWQKWVANRACSLAPQARRETLHGFLQGDCLIERASDFAQAYRLARLNSIENIVDKSSLDLAESY